MPRRPALEDRLDRLSVLLREGDPDTARPDIRKSLGDRSNYLVAKAVKVAAELGAGDLADDLATAFDRFMKDPVRTDKGCEAKTAIARALVDLDALQDDVYLRGVRHRQPEPSFGKPVDTAVPLRAACAEGLLIVGHPDLGLMMTDLLVDPEMPARVAAVRVLAASGRPEAEPLLRLKAYLGDAETEVTCEALTGLLAASPRRSLPFAAGFLDHADSAAVEAAAMALGESRLEDAVPLLRGRYERCSRARLKQTLLVAISMLRREPGLELLLSLVKEADLVDAKQAIVALAIHRGDESVRERLEEALAERGDTGDLGRFLAQEFR